MCRIEFHTGCAFRYVLLHSDSILFRVHEHVFLVGCSVLIGGVFVSGMFER